MVCVCDRTPSYLCVSLKHIYSVVTAVLQISIYVLAGHQANPAPAITEQFQFARSEGRVNVLL